MEIATALTTLGTALRRELLVDAKKQGEEFRVLQQGMAHWDWSRFCGRKTLRNVLRAPGGRTAATAQLHLRHGAKASAGRRCGVRDPPILDKAATVPKTGRNDPCPCGSGKKYKHCCLEKDRAEEFAPATAQRVAMEAQKAEQAALRRNSQEELREALAALKESQALDAASNAVVDLVHAGRLDEAEQAARELLVRYPEVHDGFDRLGMVHEARGQFREAADCYRKVIEFARANPDDHDPALVDSFVELVADLDARAAEANGHGTENERPG